MFWIILLILHFGVGAMCAGYHYGYFTQAFNQSAERDKREKHGAWLVFFLGLIAAPAVLFCKYTRGRMTDYGWRKWW